MTIQVGDMVTWQTTTPARRYLHTVYGHVVSVSASNATVLHHGHKLAIVELERLTKVGPVEAVTDDYAFAIGQAGSLSGTALD